MRVQKKRSKEKDAFFKEFFGEMPKTVEKTPRRGDRKNRLSWISRFSPHILRKREEIIERELVKEKRNSLLAQFF
ncbi:hypothetical protein C7S20_00160 [Christiangramia fulva]|uniref:Uncharacterized protein n=1 Tax=Christiangramia fulva TaxID=2126553 RepID=A0A2R3Z0M0_9FLAO|nr:hypothetical protein C7S20_00160 [Christiangramia fulva]